MSSHETLKAAKEAFVTGHSGSTPWECFLICVAAPLGIWCCSSSESWVVEVLALLLPMLLNQTNYLYPWGVGYMGVLAVFGFIMKQKQASPIQSVSSSKSPASLSFYRAVVLYLTFVAILAVDFPLFPRRFAKTEVEGYGLMDLGAASFVIAAGLVSRRGRGSNSTSRRNMGFLLLIGGIRLATTKGLEYQEHVSEYGVYWNFFFTLALMTPLSAMLPMGWVAPTIMMGTYQIALEKFDLQEYVETGSRRCESQSILCNAFAANREGILGCIGYLSLYLASEYIGHLCLWSSRQPLWKPAAFVTVLWIMLKQYAEASRRSTNATFCTWSLAHNLLLLMLIQFANPTRITPVLGAIHRNSLGMFVVSNLLTGLFNLTLNTTTMEDGPAAMCMILYLTCVSLAAVGMDKVKVWWKNRKSGLVKNCEKRD